MADFTCQQLQSEGLKGGAIKKAFQTGEGEALCKSGISLLPSPSFNFSVFFLSLGNLAWLLPLCFVCTVWGCAKIPVFKIQEEHFIPGIVFICFHILVSILCSGVQVQLCKGACEPVQAKLNAKPFRLVTPPVVYVRVWWFVAESVWKDGLLMGIIGLVSESFILK